MINVVVFFLKTNDFIVYDWCFCINRWCSKTVWSVYFDLSSCCNIMWNILQVMHSFSHLWSYCTITISIYLYIYITSLYIYLNIQIDSNIDKHTGGLISCKDAFSWCYYTLSDVLQLLFLLRTQCRELVSHDCWKREGTIERSYCFMVCRPGRLPSTGPTFFVPLLSTTML